MPLNIPTGGNVKPFIRFKPSLNAWEISNNGGAQEIAFDKPALFDLQHIQLGWLLLAEGVRDWHPWPNNEQTAKPAEGDYKPGFEVEVYSTTMFGDEPVRTFATSGTGPTMFIQELYNEAEKAPEWAQGLNPVVQLTGSKAVKVGKGNTRVPQFKIVKWAPWPTGNAPAPAPAPARAAAPAPAPAPATADDEF